MSRTSLLSTRQRESIAADFRWALVKEIAKALFFVAFACVYWHFEVELASGVALGLSVHFVFEAERVREGAREFFRLMDTVEAEGEQP